MWTLIRPERNVRVHPSRCERRQPGRNDTLNRAAFSLGQFIGGGELDRVEVERELEEAELTKLIEQIDEDLVLSADMPREDFLVSVYVGKDVGFYSDDYFTEENNNNVDFEDDEEH